MYIQNEDELELRNNEVADHAEERRARRADAEEGGEDKVDSVFMSMGDDSDEEGAAVPKKVAPAPKVKANPNTSVAPANKMMKLKDLKTLGDALPAADPTAGMNRKEREAVESAARKEAHQQRHMAGQTPEAKKELAILAEVKARREAARLKRESEGRAPGWVQPESESDSDADEDSDSEDELPRAKMGGGGAAAAPAKKEKAVAPVQLGTMTKEVAAKKKEKALAVDEPSAAGGDMVKLSNIDIKKMNPAELKEHLKARNLDLQGQKKDLMKRLTDYEASR